MTALLWRSTQRLAAPSSLLLFLPLPLICPPLLACLHSCLPQALDKMAREWEHAELGVLEYRETRTYIIKVGRGRSEMGQSAG